MNAMLRSVAIGVIACAPCVGSAAQTPSASDASPAIEAPGHVLDKAELTAIYSNRTWRWDDGAGYFNPNRKFLAWIGDHDRASFAEGNWAARNDGTLCFRATWHALSGDTKQRSCFAHQSDGTRIYQRKLPDGPWYVFGRIPSQAGDEVRKLQLGDHVSETYGDNKQYVTMRLRERRN